jgi:hypothetical protein
MKSLCVFLNFSNRFQQVSTAHAGCTHTVIKYWGLSGLQIATPTGNGSYRLIGSQFHNPQQLITPPLPASVINASCKGPIRN